VDQLLNIGSFGGYHEAGRQDEIGGEECYSGSFIGRQNYLENALKRLVGARA